MRIALIAEHFPPMRTSCAVQMRDLAREFRVRGHDVTVLVPSHTQAQPWVIDDFEGIEVVRLKAPGTRDRGNVIRVLGELAMPFAMLRNFRASPANVRKFDGIAWYSPTIFLGALAFALKRQHNCPAYLILRDIFPQWAVDVGVLKRGPAFHLLNRVARFQYAVADTIGVQSPGNLAFFANDMKHGGKNVEVLQNWMQPPTHAPCSIDLSKTAVADRKVFVYAGNMGVAQGMNKLLELASELSDNAEAGFVFVGRGDAVVGLKAQAQIRGITNALFFDEIEPDEISGLYAQCDVGMVALDARHKSHNIPGKFISYMHAGLPVLAAINDGNDLVDIINDERVGLVSTDPAGTDLPQLARQILVEDGRLKQMRQNALALARSKFSAAQAASQIEMALGFPGNSSDTKSARS